MSPDGVRIVPFLKWAGGKRWFAERAIDLLPKSYDRYVEPFLGSGALYFSLRPARALLADANARLMETYDAIRSDWKKVGDHLAWHQRKHDHDHYYAERARVRRSLHARAAQFIYLNRTCWNGLYRVNVAGQFNVPIGTKTTVVLETDDFEKIATQMRRCKLRCSDFETVLDDCGRGDFVFVDPPYTVKHNMNGFVRYNETLFSWADQIRLRDCVVAAVRRGAKVLVTNADHPSIRKLYRDFAKIRPITRASVLAADAGFRTQVNELVITTWER